MDRGAWQIIIHGVAKSVTLLSDCAQNSTKNTPIDLDQNRKSDDITNDE